MRVVLNSAMIQAKINRAQTSGTPGNSTRQIMLYTLVCAYMWAAVTVKTGVSFRNQTDQLYFVQELIEVQL